MKVRKATERDWPAVLRLIRENPEHLMQDHLPRTSEFFVAVEDDVVLGCCALEVYSKRLAEIRSLAVAKQCQRSGIATQLVEKCMTLAKKKEIYEVLAITSALPFFEKHGFNTFQQEKYALFKVLG
jgi:amino-acid N-acetyltransferase